MSNHLAIATVTGTLSNLLSSAAMVVPGAQVVTKRPAAPGDPQGPGINIFLYQIAPNAAYRNVDLPTRRSNGELVQRPQAALVLHYLLCFYGEEGKLEPQRLLGAVIRHLHSQPLLTRQDITSTITNPPYDTLLASSNLADQVDSVRFTPLNLSLEELTKIWSVFLQVPYLLSVAYQASAVCIETDDAPRGALPVKTRNLYVLPFRQPEIDQVVSQAGDNEPIFLTSTLVIRGKQLRSDATLVLLGGVERAPVSINDTEITLPLPSNLAAGVHALQVVQKITMGAPPGMPHRGFESNVATFVLRPQINAVPAKTTVANPGGASLLPLPALRITVDVNVRKDQRVALLLNSTSTTDPQAYSFVSPQRASDTKSFTIPIPDALAGDYFIRVQIDGAASPIEFDSSSPTFGPTVTLP